jgi:hypothetical protein
MHHIGKTLTITGESKTVANGKIRPYVFWKPTDMMSVLLFISSIVQVDLIRFERTNQQSFTFAGPEEIFRKAAINSLILSPTRRPTKNKTKSSGAIPTLIFKACFSSENNKELK